MTDVIDLLTGTAPGSGTDSLRRRRPTTREQAQASFEALFRPGSRGPEHAAGFDAARATLGERAAVAAFVARLHDDATAVELYLDVATEAGDEAATAAERALLVAERAATTGPYGDYPEHGPLAVESVDGIRLSLDDAERAALGDRLAAALEHAHLLVFRPREASPEALRRLGDAGWTTDGIVTLSQLVSFLAFQLRVVAGLRLLAQREARPLSASADADADASANAGAETEAAAARDAHDDRDAA